MIAVAARTWRDRPELRTPGLHDRLLRLWIEAEVARLAGERLRQQLAAGQPGPEGSAAKLVFARLNQEISGFEVELAGGDGLRYDDWTMRRPEQRRLLRPRPRLPLPARQGQLHRGRHLGDPAQHRRRAGARPPRRTPRRQGRAMEGPTPVSDNPGAKEDLPDLLYSDAERALSDALASLLADRGGLDAVLERIESAQTYDDKLWQSVAADLGCAGLLIPERDGGAGASYREAAVAAEVLGANVAPVPFLGSAVVATAALLSVAAGRHATGPDASQAAADLLAKMADGGVTAALAVPFATAPGTAYPGPGAGGRRSGPATPPGWRGCAGWSPGSPTRCPPGCCSSRPTACRTASTWSTWPPRASPRRR